MTCPTPSKIHHPTEAAARSHKRSLLFKGGSIDLNVYRCPCGAGWCVGHSAYSLRRRIRRALSKR